MLDKTLARIDEAIADLTDRYKIALYINEPVQAEALYDERDRALERRLRWTKAHA
nr:hypothetical protein [Rhodococcus sp. (in: high G+C Gram-positive bacteria)]